MRCDQITALIPVYADGELSEELSGPLRQHLLECAACRGRVQEEKALSGWFVPSAEVPVPEGFAARVARRAVAGDRGLLTPVPPPARSEERALGFTLRMTAVAAALLLGLTLLLASKDGARVGGEGLQAGPTLEQALEELDRMNQAESAANTAAGEKEAEREEEDGR